MARFPDWILWLSMDLGYLYGRGWFVQGLRKDKVVGFQ